MTESQIRALRPGQLVECKGAFGEVTTLEVHEVIQVGTRLKKHFRPVVKKPGRVIDDCRFLPAWPPEDVIRVVTGGKL